MTPSADFQAPDRRAFLRRAGLAAAAGASLPLLGSGPSPAFAAVDDPDQLFKEGKFAAAERGYRRVLREDPRNAHAYAQTGYIALLSNRFGDAEKHLSKAVALRPGDIASAQRLAECFVRQDQLARAIPLLQGTGRPRDRAYGDLYSHISGTPWQIHGAQSAHVPFVTLDPVPAVEASLNGGKPGKFWLDTYATLDLSREVAEAAGLRAVATHSGGVANNQPITIWLGVLDSFKIGNIEIRSLPVQWSDAQRPSLPDGSTAAGAFGTTIFYHFLTTMNYAGRALTLRRKTKTAPRARAADRLPLWLAGDHYPCTLGSLGDDGPRMVTLDTGGIGSGLDTTVEIAERVGMAVDYDHPIQQPGTKLYPITAERISLGGAVGRKVPGHAAEQVFPGFPGPGQSAQFGFDLIANFTHEFFKPFAITFDYTDMRLYITRG
ncbi:tetratricopeptide repeat protein [Nonomuraea sp. NEAU-A123]|uniref:tetratricopeptide repeat protein n=1 Tax=Nonomuraea sp. NEAU-A123 TaxID=2839649 RepID=UPI001BE44D40|nr:tetratricopeptide repeat protein [Nonomuraea sp. NEAU-A123]MBT2227175.1 aspartyl protease family protein [Nonomuraea sp. NEAU-A123]